MTNADVIFNLGGFTVTAAFHLCSLMVRQRSLAVTFGLRGYTRSNSARCRFPISPVIKAVVCMLAIYIGYVG